MLVYLFELDSAINLADRSGYDLSEVYDEVLRGNSIVVSDNQIVDSDVLFGLFLEKSRLEKSSRKSIVASDDEGIVEKQWKAVRELRETSRVLDSKGRRATPLDMFERLIEEGVIIYGEHGNTHSPSQYVQEKLESESFELVFDITLDKLNDPNKEDMPMIDVYSESKNIHLCSRIKEVSRTSGKFRITIDNIMLLNDGDVFTITIKNCTNTVCLKCELKKNPGAGATYYVVAVDADGNRLMYPVTSFRETSKSYFYFGCKSMGFLNPSYYQEESRRLYGLSACYKLRDDLRLSIKYHDAHRLIRNWGSPNSEVSDEYIEAIFPKETSYDDKEKMLVGKDNLWALVKYVELLLKFSIKDGRVGQIIDAVCSRKSIMDLNEIIFKTIPSVTDDSIGENVRTAVTTIHNIYSDNPGLKWNLRSFWYNDYKKGDGSIIRIAFKNDNDSRTDDEKWTDIKRALDLYNNYSIEYNTLGTALRYDPPLEEKSRSLLDDFIKRFDNKRNSSLEECFSIIRGDRSLRKHETVDWMVGCYDHLSKDTKNSDLNSRRYWINNRYEIEEDYASRFGKDAVVTDQRWTETKKVLEAFQEYADSEEKDVKKLRKDVENVFSGKKIDWFFFNEILFDNGGSEVIKRITSDWLDKAKRSNECAKQHVNYVEEYANSSKDWLNKEGDNLKHNRLLPLMFIICVLGTLIVAKGIEMAVGMVDIASNLLFFALLSMFITSIPDLVQGVLNGMSENLFRYRGTMDGLKSLFRAIKNGGKLKRHVKDSGWRQVKK